VTEIEAENVDAGLEQGGDLIRASLAGPSVATILALLRRRIFASCVPGFSTSMARKSFTFVRVGR